MNPELPPSVGLNYPFESHYFQSEAGRMHYVDEGDGPAVIMVHGNPTWSYLYRDLINELKPYYRCLAIDHLGCGLSDKPNDPQIYNLSEHINRLEAWVESLELESFVMIVHDWGGPIGLGAAAGFREKVKGLIITNTAAFPFQRLPFRISICRWPLLGVLGVRGANTFVRAAKTMTTVKPLSTIEKLGYSFPYNSWDNRIAIHRFVEDIPMDKTHPSYERLEALEQSLSLWKETPVSLHWGMQDWCFHPMLISEFQKRISHASVNEYANAGHYLFEDEPKNIFKHIQADLAEWWSR